MTKQGKNARSGQILAISALVIALIMTSTATYIYELSGNIGEADTHMLNDFIQSIKLGSRHVIIGALANITNGGQSQTLTASLNEWRTAVGWQYSLGKFTLNYTLRDTAPYSSGLYINWSSNESGVSEAYTSFLLNASGKEVEMQFPYYVNVSTRLYVEGFMTQISPSNKQVTVMCRVFNEGQPALTKNLTIYYSETGQWVEATDSLVVNDYGNGTYRATFMVETSATVLDVSAHVLDLRRILVQANATCLQQ